MSRRQSDDERTDAKTRNASSEHTAIRLCAACNKNFRPKKQNQEYCRIICRSRALRYRKQAARLTGGASRGAVPILHALRTLQRDRKARGQRPAERHPYLSAYCAVVEAEQQIAHWQRQLAKRREQLAQLEAPALRADVAIVTPDQPLPPQLSGPFWGSACTDGKIGVFAVGNPQS